MEQLLKKTILSNGLYGEYNWFQSSFVPKIQQSSDEFFLDLFKFKLISLSENMNTLFEGCNYFVTKIRMDKQHDVYVRVSEDAVGMILDKILGKNEKENDINKITDLEVKVLRSFNEYLYNRISPLLLYPSEERRRDYNIIHMTFYILDEETEQSAKIIISVPKILLQPQIIEHSSQSIFKTEDFRKCRINIKLRVGTTKFTVSDLKRLEADDIVIFENSSIDKMTLIHDTFEKEFKITPNTSLIMSIDNGENDGDDNGGNDMANDGFGQNLWDSIQVEMGAEFDKIKMSLGELKNIEQGLVVDISSVYNNKINLRVDNKTIATGELIIINDRYGVKIDEVIAPENNDEEVSLDGESESGIEVAKEEPTPKHKTPPHPQPHHKQQEEQPQDATEEEEEFDYSDFELDDEDI